MMMSTRVLFRTAMAIIAFALLAAAEDLADISLPAPRTEGGKPLMQTLKERRSVRSFRADTLPMQTLSDLLWAAFGINRSESGKRTAPSARNWQEVEVYVILENGAYLYDPKALTLKAVVKGDLRPVTGAQKFVASAPLNLVYVADIAKMKGTPDDITLISGADVGFISQNVYLFCASQGLGTVVRGSVNREATAKALKLSGKKKVILAQTVGYPGANAE